MTNSVHHTRAEKLFLQAARTFNDTLEYEEIIERVLNLVMTAVDAQAALVFRVDHDRTDMKIRYMNCSDCRMQTAYRELGSGVVGWVTKYHEPVIINETANDDRVDWELGRLLNLSLESIISIPLIGKGQMIGVIKAINKRHGQFNDFDLDVLMGLADQIAVAIDNAHLYRAVKREALQKNLLFEIGKQLAGSLELDDLLREIMLSLKQVVGYNAGGIFLVEAEQGELTPVYHVGYDKTGVSSLRLKVGQGLIGDVAKTGEAIIVSDVSTDPRYVRARKGTQSEIVVPMMLDGKVIGAFTLESDQLNAYEHEHLSLLSAFASQAAVSIERAQLHRRIVAASKLEHQLQVAREIQQSFLPDKFPQINGYDIVGMNISSEQVGGDYYDFVSIVEGQTGIVIGDVAGKGVGASLIMASFRASLIAEIRNNYAIVSICAKVNNLLVESTSPENFVTAVYGVLNTKDHQFTYVNCGHNFPVLVRPSGEVKYLRQGGPLLGIIGNVAYDEETVPMNPGDVLLLYTDGVSEVFDSEGQEFGLDRTVALLRQNSKRSALEIQESIVTAVKKFAGPDHKFDDLTMIVIKRTG